jgi:hypothetical protein
MDYSKEHTKQRPGKAPVSAKPTPGTDKMGGKNHETDIAHSEGLAIGSVHPAHTKETVMGAKHNPAPHKAAHAQRARVLAGNANTMGEGSVTNQETGHQAHVKSNSKVQQKAHGYNERSIAGNANPSAMPDDSEV